MSNANRLAYLRRARVTVHRHLARLEPLVEGYHAKLAEIEAEIHELAPELFLQPRRYNPNPIMERGEITRLALDVLREEGGPLPIRVIAVRVLALKGIRLPDRATMRRMRHRLRNAFGRLDRRRVTMRIGEGSNAERTLADLRD